MKALKTLYLLTCILLIAWFLVSWGDIVMHNIAPWEPNYACYQPWNLFIILKGVVGL